MKSFAARVDLGGTHLTPVSGGTGACAERSRSVPPVRAAVAFLLAGLAAAALSAQGTRERVHPPRGWVLEETRTLAGVGATQGATSYGDKLYVYGDANTGVIVEFTLELEPTGRRLALTRGGHDLISHPTGLTFHPRYGAFVGDSPRGLFGRRATLYQIDWERALAEGRLDHAIRAVIRDDAALAGTRPTFVRWRDRWYLATTDYAPQGQVRLYDPEKLRDGGRTSEPGVLVAAFALEGRTQSLVWEDETGWLYCVQNTGAGRGWRVQVVDLETALAPTLSGQAGGRYDAPGLPVGALAKAGALVEQVDFPFESELEGLVFLPRSRFLFLTSEPQNNARLGHWEAAH